MRGEDLVEEVRDTIGLTPESPIGWVVAVDRSLTVDADNEQLLRVLVNLTRNARQALESRAPNDPARDQIRISGRREGTVSIIEVSDTGPGFSPRAREHLFEAFQCSTRTGGSGLGLAISLEDARLHGGWLQAWGERGRGSVFRLTVPIVAGQPIAGSPLPLGPDEAEVAATDLGPGVRPATEITRVTSHG